MFDSALTIGTDKIFVYINTHDPATGNESDADVLPIYRIYEEGTDAPILTGTFAKLDDTNTTGFYFASEDLLSASGFENSKNYSIRISAQVNGITGVKVLSFILKDPLLNKVEGVLTLKDFQRVMFAALAGQTVGGGTLSNIFKSLAGDKDRITATVDEDGNRIILTFDVTD